MTTLAERIQEVLDSDSGLNQVELAEIAGVTKGATNQWLTGAIKSLKLEYALKIEAATGFSAQWLVTGKGVKKVKDRDAIAGARQIGVYNAFDVPPGMLKIRKVKLALSAGILGFSIEEEIEDDEPYFLPQRWFERNGYQADKLIALTVKGESMQPQLYAGAMVIIDTADTKPKDEEVFAVNFNGEAVIKRLKREMGFWWLYSDNPDQKRFPPERCEGDSCIIIGRAAKLISDRI